MQGMTGSEQYVEFGVGTENYAIGIAEVHEIIRLQAITEIPNGPAYIEGVINLRGKIVPVIGLRRLFGLPDREADKATRIVVLRSAAEFVGVIVDRVNQVAVFADIQPPPERIGGLSGSMFHGIGLSSTGLVGILKLEELLYQS